MKRTWMVCCVALLLAAVPALAADVVPSGDDVWKTVGGMTHTTFAKDPIPADFFCAGSKPFTGKLSLHGARLAAEPAANLGEYDTVVRRLDTAQFNEKGEAKTRIQLLALNLVSIEPIETECGKYDVAVSLDGDQPTTEMKIVRTTTDGGYFVAPLALNIKVAFNPVAGNSNPRRVLSRQVDLGSGSTSVWSASAPAKFAGAVQVDTDGDSRPDTFMPTPGKGFVAGVAPYAVTAGTGVVIVQPARCLYLSCHCAEKSTDPWEDPTGCKDDHLHCTEVWVSCADLEERGLEPYKGISTHNTNGSFNQN